MYFLLKRTFDILASLLAIMLLFPFLLVISIWILIDSPGGIFYGQIRVGRNGREFKLLKFRSMRPGADKSGELTVGDDKRVTKVGRFIRKYKLDEFPQLINILAGDMSVVGPRPEVPRYVALYSPEQRKVLSVLPGLTDYATLEYIDEQKILGESADPEKAYVEKVMPAKLELNLKYLDEKSFGTDLRLVFRTIAKILR